MTINNNRVEGIYNLMETLVWTELERIVQTERDDVCFCSLCKLDISAYALNRLPALYVSTQEGETRFTNLEMDKRVTGKVVEAIKHIAEHPHRANRTMTEYTVNELFDYIDK
ncbi:late competence development ComFB family protein [Alicyclobacillus mengziensis]|uniref:Late competence development ComFB family protein n=1 Tax=Alicyclobacillus mengziensis TaxID=2931921 RepID=A0A9X7Z7F3_9BACL|nr:late competence development ComFB family protein [Alicyclobacillus mengziensis]QSO48362.1 late competence development ComFB family protein [Alicyclobacillus mengziensis]